MAYTPGHASHHVSYLHEDSGDAFVGDVAGVRVPPHGFAVPPTPPPDIDLELWEASLQTLEGWEPTALCLTHFGRHAALALLSFSLHQPPPHRARAGSRDPVLPHRRGHKSSRFTTRIVDEGGTTLIVQSGQAIPNMWVPPWIGPAIIAAGTRKQWQEIRAEILRRKAP